MLLIGLKTIVRAASVPRVTMTIYQIVEVVGACNLPTPSIALGQDTPAATSLTRPATE
jgi:hypothetical protein